MSSNTAIMGNLPSGIGIYTTIPDIFYLPELIFGGLVWILVACTLVVPQNPQGWVMFVSVFCFIMTFIWMLVFACGGHHNNSSWATADVLYHVIAAFFYLSASVVLAKVTLDMKDGSNFQIYQLDISAVVFSYVSTLLYFIHSILSAIRWKSF
ncbi:myelin and lymphocyte protein [Takifugu rubripes]|uniref:Mal, T cell differentiation protein a, tandem duplicate 1 n=1 Tax=Takifugu rubripes TaxID=31033 RepID=H2UDB2_TAKRU|nr:myelin and lymphocyte protein [Takifugu rubripes]XP_056892154.1 myelin and lymphocyte protein-like isoform X2 [Takifugu flavidus]|eukprot:XP_003972259.1 PREDICTED: myelin and lymphocyte protein [Takifugu rubripes]